MSSVLRLMQVLSLVFFLGQTTLALAHDCENDHPHEENEQSAAHCAIVALKHSCGLPPASVDAGFEALLVHAGFASVFADPAHVKRLYGSAARAPPLQ